MNINIKNMGAYTLSHESYYKVLPTLRQAGGATFKGNEK